MPDESQLRFVIRTPHDVVFDELIRSARLRTDTGQVGLRAFGEPGVLAVEPGLILIHMDDTWFAGSAGGLLEHTGRECTLYTPFAVVDESEVRVVEGLQKALAIPSDELSARHQLEELERRLAQDLRDPHGRRIHRG